jgi:hypothetical protein
MEQVAIDDPRMELVVLVVLVISHGVIKQQGALVAAVGAVVASWRDLQGARLLVKHDKPIGIFPASIEQLEQAVTLDHTIIVRLVSMHVELV